MSKVIEDYVKKVLEIGCNIQKDDDIIVYSNVDINALKIEFLKLKDIYGINQMFFVEENYEKIYNFLKNNPNEDEIKQFVVKYPTKLSQEKTKMIFVVNDDHSGYYNKLFYELLKLYQLYHKYDYEYNKEFWDLTNIAPVIGITCPNKFWAKHLLGSEDKIEQLWQLINNTIPNISDFKEEIERLKEIKMYLQMSNISQLHFYTKLGTDFRLSLTGNSLWVSEPTIKNNFEYFYNFPSYEIFTSPNCYSAEGKVVVTKPSSLYGERINNAELVFTKGQCISCDSDNDKWNEMVLYKKNKIYRIGEISLVSKESPIAKSNQIYDSVLLDENAGCHLALGNSIKECINIPEYLIKEKGLRYYKFNESLYHQDLIFGDDSITVEAQTRNKQKILLLENGIWKI